MKCTLFYTYIYCFSAYLMGTVLNQTDENGKRVNWQFFYVCLYSLSQIFIDKYGN